MVSAGYALAALGLLAMGAIGVLYLRTASVSDAKKRVDRRRLVIAASIIGTITILSLAFAVFGT